MNLGNTTRPIRVLLVDDHRTTLWGLERLIDSARPAMQCTGSACSIEQLLAHPALREADVVVLDLDLAGVDAAPAIPQILSATQAQILVLTGQRDPEAHQRAVLVGARGLIGKDEPAEKLLTAIKHVHAGHGWLNPALTGRLLASLSGRTRPAARDPATERIASLTRRERQIISSVVNNCGAKGTVIATDLGISENTLRNHLTVIYDKLAIHNRLELYALATERGLSVPE